jgi:hypothetical protein
MPMSAPRYGTVSLTTGGSRGSIFRHDRLWRVTKTKKVITIDRVAVGEKPKSSMVQLEKATSDNGGTDGGEEYLAIRNVNQNSRRSSLS